MDVSGVNSNLFQLLWQTQSSAVSNQDTEKKSVFSEGINSLMPGPNPLELSGPAEMFAKLQQLAADDPEKFKATMTEIADKLEAAAEETGDTKEGRMLKDMAAKFRKAAETGDPGELPGPPQGSPPPPPGGMKGGGIESYMKQSSDSSESLLDLLSAEEDEEESTTAASNVIDMRELFSAIREILNDAISENSGSEES